MASKQLAQLLQKGSGTSKTDHPILAYMQSIYESMSSCWGLECLCQPSAIAADVLAVACCCYMANSCTTCVSKRHPTASRVSKLSPAADVATGVADAAA